MKKSVKKNLLTACLLLMLGLLTWTLMGCGNTGEEESSVDMSEAGGGNTITVLNYGEYIDTSVLRDFEKETGIKVLYEEATTPEEMYSKYTSSTIPYDLIFRLYDRASDRRRRGGGTGLQQDAVCQ